MTNLEIQHKLDVIEMNYKDLREILLHPPVNNEIDRLKGTIDDLEKQVQHMKYEVEKYIAILNRSDHELDTLRDQIDGLNEVIAAKDIQIADLKANGSN